MHDILTIFSPKPGLTSINIDTNGVAVVQVHHNKGQHGGTPVITQCLYKTVGRRKDDLHNTLQSLSNKLGLKRSNCTTILASRHYQLLLTDKPKVPEDELATALRWQVKDLIDRPIDDTTFEVFPAPAAADSTKPEQAYLLAAANQAIQERADLLANARINLHSIDIHEMALRNLTLLLPDPEQTTALLWLDKDKGTLIIVRNGTVYMTRAIGIGMNHLDDETNQERHNDSLMLEIQRSLDYYEARYQAAPIRNIMLAPGISDCATALSGAIKQTLDIDALDFNLDGLIKHQANMPENWQRDHFIGIGAALRHEEAVT